MFQSFDTTFRFGVLLLLVWTPLAFGAVHAWAYALLEVHAFLLVAAWMGQRLIAQLQPTRAAQDSSAFVWAPLALPLMLFGALLLFQLLPLPSGVLTRLSPATADLYRLFRPDWPETHVPLSLDPYATHAALVRLHAYGGLLGLLLTTLRTSRHIQAVCVAIVATACAMALLGIAQKLSGTSAIYWIRDTSYASFFGPYVNRNHFAWYQTISILLGVGLLLGYPTRVASAVSASWRHRLLRRLSLLSPARIALVTALAVMLGALSLSGSRGGVLSLFLGLVLFGLLLRTRHIRMERQVLLAMAVVAMVGMALWLGLGPLLSRFELLAEQENARVPGFQAAWAMSHDFPLFGIGYEAFPVLSSRYLPATELLASGARLLQAHNDFLQLLAETGWIGLLLVLSGVLLGVGIAVKRWRSQRDPFVQVMVAAGLASLVAMGFHSLVDFNWHIPANALLGTTVLALTCACANLPRRQAAEPAQEKKRKRCRRTRRLGAALLAFIGILSALWLASVALRTAVADLSYPQQVPQQPSHWIYRVEPAVAHQRLRQALAWTPDNPWYWQRLATLEAEAALPLVKSHELMDEGWLSTVTQLQRAAAAYERARQLQPTEPYTQLGWLYVAQALADLHPAALRHDAEDIAAQFPHIATLAPSNPNVQYHLGYLLLTSGAMRSAGISPLPFFQHALRLDASYDRHVLRAYLDQLSEPEALHHFALALPNTPQAHLKAAQLLEFSRWPYARLYYGSALILGGSDPALLKDYGQALLRHEEYTAARDIWARLLEATPDDAEAYLGLTAAMRGLGDHEGEVQTLQQLVSRFPQEPDYYARLAQAHMERGNMAAAEAAWTQVSKLQPHEAEGYVGLARLYAFRGDGAAAIRMMQRAVGLAPDHAGYQQALARLYEQGGNRALARQVYQGLTIRQPTEAYPYYKLGEYLWQEGEGLRALTYYRRAVQLRPDHAGFRRALERAVQQSAKK